MEKNLKKNIEQMATYIYGTYTQMVHTHIYTHIYESLCCMPETNTTL